MVSNASEDLPEPESPVITTSWSRGISRSMFLRLCSRAPRMTIRSLAMPPYYTARLAGARPARVPVGFRGDGGRAIGPCDTRNRPAGLEHRMVQGRRVERASGAGSNGGILGRHDRAGHGGDR